MNILRKICLYLSLFFCVFYVFGCKSGDNIRKISNIDSKKMIKIKKGNKESEYFTGKRIALVMKAKDNPFYLDMEKGGHKAEEELGIQLIIKTISKETAVDEQIDIVNDLIEDKVDGIVIAPASSKEIIPVLKKAENSGIVIINLDNKLDEKISKEEGLNNIPFIGVDNEKGAYLSCKYISDKIKTPSKAIIIEGIRGNTNSDKRKEGAIKAFSENHNINLVDVETANWSYNEAKDLASNIFKKHKDIKAVFCANDMMALGVIEYLDSINKEDVLIAGYDDLFDAKKAIKSGKMKVTVDQQASMQGYFGVKYAFDSISKIKVPLENYIDVKIINEDNINIK